MQFCFVYSVSGSSTSLITSNCCGDTMTAADAYSYQRRIRSESVQRLAVAVVVVSLWSKRKVREGRVHVFGRKQAEDAGNMYKSGSEVQEAFYGGRESKS
jgi:hypothetical protein